MAEYRVIPFTLDMWNYSVQQLAEKYFDAKYLENRKAIGLSRVYSITFYQTADEDDYEDYDEETEMGSYHRSDEEFYIQSPSYNEVVQYIRDNTSFDIEVETYKSQIVDKLALVFETK